jgi:hypothetical protein
LTANFFSVQQSGKICMGFAIAIIRMSEILD